MATSFDVDVRCRVIKRKASAEFIKTEKAIQESYETIEQYRSIIRNIDNHCNEQLAILEAKDTASKRAVDVRRCGRIVQAMPMAQLPAIAEKPKQVRTAKSMPRRRITLAGNKNQKTYMPSTVKVNAA